MPEPKMKLHAIYVFPEVGDVSVYTTNNGEYHVKYSDGWSETYNSFDEARDGIREFVISIHHSHIKYLDKQIENLYKDKDNNLCLQKWAFNSNK